MECKASATLGAQQDGKRIDLTRMECKDFGQSKKQISL